MKLIYKFCLLFFSCLIVIFINSHDVIAQETKQNDCKSEQISCENFSEKCLTKEFLESLSPYSFGKFGDISGESALAQLDAFTQKVQNSSRNARGYIVYYGGRVNKYGEYKIRTNAVMDYLLKFRRLDPSRYKLVNGGFRNNFEFELWISEIGDVSPPLSPTVLAEDVKFRGKMKPLFWEM